MAVGSKLLGALILSSHLLGCGGSVARQRAGDDQPAPPPDSSMHTGGSGTHDPPMVVGVSGAGSSAAAGGAAGAPVLGGAAGAGELGGGAGGAAEAGAGGEGGSRCTEGKCTRPEHLSPRWVSPVTGHGRGAAFLRFLGDGDSVEVGLGEPGVHTRTTLRRATGEVVGTPVRDRQLVASDRGGRRLVRETDEGTVLFLDEVEAARWERPIGRRITFSSDGAVLTSYSCEQQDQQPRFVLSVYESETASLLASVSPELPCSFSDLTMLVDSERGRTLFAHPKTPDLYVFDWAAGTIRTMRVHEEAPVSTSEPFNHEGTVLNLALSPDGRTLASVGAADGLAWLDANTLTLRARLPDVPFFNVYDLCYCERLSESPVAWSPRGASYVTAHAGGGLAVRGARTHEVLTVLDPPTIERHLSSRDLGPVLVEFSPSGAELVAIYPEVAVSYELSR